MATVQSTTGPPLAHDAAAMLQEGMRMDQPTFHALYEQMPEGFKAELIGGAVSVASPTKAPHSFHHGAIVEWLRLYRRRTPGTECLIGATTILGGDSEPQADAGLLILGGQTHRNAENYIVGSPELMVEVSDATARTDLKGKRADYERHGAQEYLVVIIPRRQIVWFTREQNSFVELQAGPDGVFRSRVFPGLWLDRDALFNDDADRVEEILKQGLASSEHAAFVQQLAERSSRG